MRVIIAGGRNYIFTDQDRETLDSMKDLIPITRVVCGMAKGADTYGKEWAISNNLPVDEYPADWKRYGKAAGPLRNKQMAANADALIVFPGGSGTNNMVNEANKRNIQVIYIGVKEGTITYRVP